MTAPYVPYVVPLPSSHAYYVYDESLAPPTIIPAEQVFTVTNAGQSQGTVWGQWVTTTAVTQTSQIWYQWAGIVASGSSGMTNVIDGALQQGVQGGGFLGYQLTPEEREAEFQRVEESRVLATAAKKKAETLLHSLLSPAQRAELEFGYFTVQSRSSHRRYRVLVLGNRHGNVKELDADGEVVASLCCAPGGMPDHDAFAAQKLYLEHDEETFRRRANITSCRGATSGHIIHQGERDPALLDQVVAAAA